VVAVSDSDGQTTNTTGLVWDRAATVPQVVTMTNAGVDTNLVYGHDRSFAVTEGAAVAFSRDVYGSALRTPATAELVRADRYHPDGRPDGATGHTPAFGYRGELDLGGLLYLRARDFDPATGVFTSTDPLDGRPGDVSEANPYPYAANDPVNQLDPFGLSPIGNGELRLIGMMASWPGSLDWHTRKPRQFGGQLLASRGPGIAADCLLVVRPCHNSKGGFEPEATAKAHAIRELSSRRQSWINRINPLDAPISDNVHWEVQVPGTRDLADIIVDDDPDDVDGDIYEAKAWVGPAPGRWSRTS
jgi:RHS repeat-associated protein